MVGFQGLFISESFQNVQKQRRVTKQKKSHCHRSVKVAENPADRQTRQLSISSFYWNQARPPPPLPTVFTAARGPQRAPLPCFRASISSLIEWKTIQFILDGLVGWLVG